MTAPSMANTVLYAPAQAILFGLSFEGMIGWIVAGLPFDCIHGVSNFFCGILVVPIVSVLRLGERGFLGQARTPSLGAIKL